MSLGVKLQKHDDRLDAISMAVKYWVDQMAADADVKIRDRRDELFDMELEKFVAGIVESQSVVTVHLHGFRYERAILSTRG